jgi:ATPases involved in chromosome partitioning
MTQIFLINSKGGCGKTLLAVHIAAYLAKSGFRTALVDHDPQLSALDWFKCRPDTCAPITVYAGFTNEVLSTNFDYVVHDMPAASEIGALQPYGQLGDKLIIPILPSPTDIKASVRFLMAVNRHPWFKQSGILPGLVANRVKKHTNYYKTLTAFLAHVNMPLLASLRETENYNKALENGISIFDLPPSRVTTDQTQWRPILNWLQSQ